MFIFKLFSNSFMEFDENDLAATPENLWVPGQATCVKSGKGLQISVPTHVRKFLKLERADIVEVLFKKVGHREKKTREAQSRKLKLKTIKDPFSSI